MARREVREVWVADDGTEFRSESEATTHELSVELAKELQDAPGIDWYDANPDVIVAFIVKRYTLTRKGAA